MAIDIEIKTLENFLGKNVKVYRDSYNRIIVDGDIIIYPDNTMFDYMPFQIYELNGNLEWHSEYGKQGRLRSLMNFPTIVNGNVCVYGNPRLTSLEYAPKVITGNFECDKCSITSLDGVSESVGKNLIASYNPIKDVKALKNIKVDGLVSLVDIDASLINEAHNYIDSSIIIKYISDDYRVII